ncbi:MAG: hypothetical protein ACREEM_48525, partial [Blastocatellia bacterium]
THIGATGLCETSKVVIERWSRFYNVRAGLEILKCRWGVRHIFAKRMGLPSAPRLTEKWGQKNGDFSESFFLPPFFC